MNPRTTIILAILAAGPLAAQPFDAAVWKGYKAFSVSEMAGIAREREPVDVRFSIPANGTASATGLRVVEEKDGRWTEVPAQFYDMRADGKSLLSGKVAFFCSLLANGARAYRIYFGGPVDVQIQKGRLTVRPAGEGDPQVTRHWMIENEFYRVETYPRSGQIWHIWDKKGSNQMWWFKEWHGKDKGGDPVHWSPNVWVGYPDRARAEAGSSETKAFAQPFEWNYVVGWTAPKTEVVSGPIFFQVTRSGPVPRWPEHSDPAYPEQPKDIVWGEVTYRFYSELPWIFQSSTYVTLQDMDVYFIRNNQTAFDHELFTHAAIRPETPGLLAGDSDETCAFPLMSYYNRMPFDASKPYDAFSNSQHSLSNVLPSKLAFFTLFNMGNGDAYANFALIEDNSTTTGEAPTMRNHHMILSEESGSDSFSRTFNYANLRFNPENMTFLPKGQKFHEENIHLVYRYENSESLDRLERLHQSFRHPLVVTWTP
jgi:hypothetical protein